jgi:heme-degrading monooxygenase HmoA
VVTNVIAANRQKKWGYVIAWEFQPKVGAEQRFEELYRSDRIWAQLFQQGEGFVGTEHGRDHRDTRRYRTLDFWESKAAYEKFRMERVSHYAAMDARCESLTEFERELGQFERVDL